MNAVAWEKIGCAEREEFFASHSGDLVPAASRTDLGGQFGQATMFTEWAWKSSEIPVLRDQRWPDPRNPDRDPGTPPYPDTEPCEHWIEAEARR